MNTRSSTPRRRGEPISGLAARAEANTRRFCGGAARDRPPLNHIDTAIEPPARPQKLLKNSSAASESLGASLCFGGLLLNSQDVDVEAPSATWGTGPWRPPSSRGAPGGPVRSLCGVCCWTATIHSLMVRRAFLLFLKCKYCVVCLFFTIVEFSL